MSSMVLGQPEPGWPGEAGRTAQKLTELLRWCSGAAALALTLAGCGGGAEAPPGATSAQLNPVAAFAVAQQSVTRPASRAATPTGSGNMVSNASFESGLTGWIDWGNTSLVSGQASSGTSALGVGAGAGGAGQEVAGIAPGHTYRLTAQAKVSAPSEIAYVGVNFIDASGAPFTQNSVLVTSTAYTTATLEVVAPPNAVAALVYGWKNAGSGVATVDDFTLEDVGPAAGQVVSSGNKVANGAFERGLAGWENWGNAVFIPGPSGSGAAQVGTGAGGFGQDVGGIVAGSRYRVSAQTRVSTPGEIGYLSVMFMDDAGTGLRGQNVVFRSTTPSTVQADVTAPAGATRAKVFVWKNAGDGFAQVDEVSLVDVAPPSPPSGTPAVLANTSTTARGVAVLKNGTRVAAWGDDSGVHSQRFDAQGKPVGSALSIAPNGTFTGVAALADGGYVVEYDQPGVVLTQIVGPAGALAGAPIVVRTQAQETARDLQPALVGGAGVYALGDGGFVAEYRSLLHFAHLVIPAELNGQRFDAAGNVVGAPTFLGNETPGPSTLVTSASTPPGGLVTAGTLLCPCGGSGLAVATVYDSTLRAVGGFGSTRSGPENTAFQSAGGLANGNYIVVWTATTPASPAGQVKGQVFALGAGNVTPVLTFANAQPGARVTALAGGGFLLSWGTSAQLFDANGQALGGVLQILDGSIAATPDGGFVVVAQVGTQLVAQQYSVGS